MHGEVFTAQFWRNVQERLEESEVLEVVPYR